LANKQIQGLHEKLHFGGTVGKNRDLLETVLSQIFDLYSKQHVGGGPKATFEDLHIKSASLNLGEFMKFCKDFNVQAEKFWQK
jgi:hypothetical protein